MERRPAEDLGMNGFGGLTGLVALTGMVAAVHAAGCIVPTRFDDCNVYPHAGCSEGGGGSTSTTTSMSTGGNGGGGAPPGSCVPSESADPVADGCGVFVSSSLGMAGNDGLKGSPFKTIQDALDAKKGKDLYVCAEEMAGSVMLSSGVTIYGGLDCHKGWTYVGATTKSVLEGETDKPALTITTDTAGAELIDFTVQAADAATPGGSSIAVVADQAKASLTRCDLIAGNGADGSAGESAPNIPAQGGTNGNSGGNACSADTVNGAAQLDNACMNGDSIGGKGGDGNKVNGGAGQVGLPNNGGGAAGLGDDGTANWSCAISGGEGKTGAPGTSGKEGAGGLASEIGTLSSSGLIGAAGQDGDPGLPGQGGGGGGGVKGDSTPGKTQCMGKPGIGGASGGSGGTGGCGGAPGKGGKGGGASIALVSLNASLTLTEVTIKAGNGGKGGAGGDFQGGGLPGNGGSGGTNSMVAGLKAGCKGGDGGTGGDGGPGGGGRGGHTIGMAFKGSAPSIDAKDMTLGVPGAGGLGGNANLKGNQGADGAASPALEFP
jgi:hypothetical protein